MRRVVAPFLAQRAASFSMEAKVTAVPLPLRSMQCLTSISTTSGANPISSMIL